jgi:hypothetical protein
MPFWAGSEREVSGQETAGMRLLPRRDDGLACTCGVEIHTKPFVGQRSYLSALRGSEKDQDGNTAPHNSGEEFDRHLGFLGNCDNTTKAI